MSYCRWGPESDVYCYAAYRYKSKSGENKIWIVHTLKNNTEVMFAADSLKELKNIFIDLKDKGFKFPDRVFDRINLELKNKK